MKKQKTRGRKDHYLPQGYLRGFTHPDREKLNKPLWHFGVHNRKWKECSAAEIGFEQGFYDPIAVGSELEIADEAFAELERKFPLVRRQILADRDSWQAHKDFLLHFMQMIRARSPLFFQQKKKEKEGQTAMEVISVDEVNRSVQYRPTSLSPAFIKNTTLMEMRAEILKGPDRLHEFDWCLRWTDDPDNPCITSDAPFVMEGTAPSLVEAWTAMDTWLYFPICWQLMMVGTHYRVERYTDRIDTRELSDVRTKYRQHADKYLVSPVKFNDF